MNLLYKEESYKIIGAAMHVWNVLGAGFLESVYQESLCIEFEKRGIPFVKEAELVINYEGVELNHKFRADFVCYDNIIVELKASKCIDDSHKSQVINYLKATGMKLGIVLNYGNYEELEYERLVRMWK